MPPVRLPEIPNVPDDRPHLAQLDPNAAAAPARALGKVAQGIADLGESFADHAEDVQRRENAGTEMELNTLWHRQRSDLEVKLQSEVDLTKRQEMVDDYLNQAKADFEARDLPPAVRDNLRPQFSRFAEGLYSGVRLDNAAEASRRADIAFKDEVDASLQTGDHGRYEQAKATAKEAGILPPEMEVGLDRKFAEARAWTSAVEEIDADPLGTFRDLTGPDAEKRYPGLNRDQLDQLRRLAAPKVEAYKANFWQGVLNNALNEGPEQAIISKEGLAELAKQGMISAEQRASYIRAWHGDREPAFDQGLYNQAFAAITAYSPAEDTTGAKLANLRQGLGTLDLPRESLRMLNSKLDERLKPADEKVHRLEATFSKMTTARFQAGGFGNWFSYQDTDGDPSTAPRRVINQKEYAAALLTEARFTEAWDTVLRNSPEGLDDVKAQELYDSLYERIALDNDDGPESSPLIPPAPPAADFLKDVDSVLGNPAPAPSEGGETSAATPAQFGGQTILPAGKYYRGAVATIFGGSNDPSDNGRSAFGGATGEGGRQGVAIPEAILRANYPGRTKEWLVENVRVVVKTDDGREAVLPVADLGTAEWVWKKNNSPTLDLTTGAAEQLGGTPIYKDGKLAGIAGIGRLDFAITTRGGGVAADLKGMTLREAQDAWWKQARPTDTEQILAGLAAVKSAWASENMEADDGHPKAPTLTTDGLPATPGTAVGDILPDLEEEEGLPD